MRPSAAGPYRSQPGVSGSGPLVPPEALHPETIAIGYGYDAQAAFGAVKPPIVLTSTFTYPSAAGDTANVAIYDHPCISSAPGQ